MKNNIYQNFEISSKDLVKYECIKGTSFILTISIRDLWIN